MFLALAILEFSWMDGKMEHALLFVYPSNGGIGDFSYWFLRSWCHRTWIRGEGLGGGSLVIIRRCALGWFIAVENLV